MQSVTAAKASNRELTKISLASVLGLKKPPGPNDPESLAEDVLILRQTKPVHLNNQSQNVNERFAIGVDELIGPEEVVVRGLPNLLKNHPLFCGITLSGSGEKSSTTRQRTSCKLLS